MVSSCFRALDGSNYDVRSAVAKLLGALLAQTQSNPPKGKITDYPAEYYIQW